MTRIPCDPLADCDDIEVEVDAGTFDIHADRTLICLNREGLDKLIEVATAAREHVK